MDTYIYIYVYIYTFTHLGSGSCSERIFGHAPPAEGGRVSQPKIPPAAPSSGVTMADNCGVQAMGSKPPVDVD